LKREITRLHLLQIDSVNVLCRSHYLPLFSRVGVYDQETLDRRTLTTKSRELFECWAHEASLVPLTLHPLMRWRMERAKRYNGTYRAMQAFARDEKTYLKSILKFITSHGPTAQSDLPEQHKGAGGWWGWSRNKLALETLFDQGLLTTARRDGFERIYDLPERVIPTEILSLPTPKESETMLRLIELASRALGIGTAFDLRDYFRLPVQEAAQATREAINTGILIPVTVEGWKQQAYLHRDTMVPRKAGISTLVSPFDPICWDRARAERIFDFHYRIELYTPAPKRKFGYYVLPFLHGEHFAGRVCLKSDRERGVLLANASHVEDGRDPGETASALKIELDRMALWLGLSSVEIGSRGNLSDRLRQLQ
jgi:uncharacterized protein